MYHDINLLRSKKVLAVCMETTAGHANYSGGLGALYGDTARTMNRLGASFLAFTPLYARGYVKQTVTNSGVLDEYPKQDFNVDYEDTGIILDVPMLGRTIKVKLWRHRTINTAYGLDAYLPENGEFAQITNILYGEYGFSGFDGEAQRLMQEVIVGVGSILAADELEYDFDILHLNEGHGVFAALYLIASYKNAGHSFEEAWDIVRSKTVFTTHTPISAGNKTRPIQMIMDLGVNFGLSYQELQAIEGDPNTTMLGATTAALSVSKIANAVALRHQYTSKELWKGVPNSCPITYIDNGVDVEYWQSPLVRDAYESGDDEALLAAHRHEKGILIENVDFRNGVLLDIDKPIATFNRRIIAYKQGDLLFDDLYRFERLIYDYGYQFIFSGKTHPKDMYSKGILMRIYEMSKKYPKNVVFLQNYNAEITGFLTKGADFALANPLPPNEACSTSGMKAALNGVINISTNDGWLYRSCRNNVTGWVIDENTAHNRYATAQAMYNLLETKAFPVFMNPVERVKMMKAAIYNALEECSADRMVHDYYMYLYNAPYLP